jgi:hypothetical protein
VLATITATGHRVRDNLVVACAGWRTMLLGYWTHPAEVVDMAGRLGGSRVVVLLAEGFEDLESGSG